MFWFVSAASTNLAILNLMQKLLWFLHISNIYKIYATLDLYENIAFWILEKVLK